MTIATADVLAALPAVLPPHECAAIYVRRSSAKGGGSNHSLQEQEDEARSVAARHGLEVTRVYVEKEGTGASYYSGKSRPEWDAALRDLDAGTGFRTLITYAIDRADRRGAEALGSLLTKHSVTGRRVLTITGDDTSDPQQRTNIILRGEMARDEAERLSARVGRTKRYRREEGRWLGGPTPYGLAVGTTTDAATGRTVSTGRLVHDPATYATARSIADALLDGATLWAVVARLNAEGVPGPRSASWRVPSLAALVRSPGWAGLQSIRHRERRPDGTWTPWPAVADVYTSPETGEPVGIGEGVITPAERTVILAAIGARAGGFVRMAATGEREERRSRGDRPSGHLLVNVLRCPACGGRTHLSGTAACRVVRCATASQGAHRCAGFSAPWGALEEHVTRRMRTYLAALDLANDDDRATLLAAAEAWEGKGSTITKARRVALEARAVELHDTDTRTVALAVAGVLSADEALVERAKVAEHLAVIDADLRSLREATVDPSALLDATATAEAWDALTALDRRRVADAVIARVTVSRAGVRGRRFDPDMRVTIEWRRANA